MTGFVYAISDGEGRVKIGWSTNPIRRLAKLNSDCPQTAVLLGAIEATKEQEAEAHRLFDRWRLSGEWFCNVGPVALFVSMLPSPKPRLCTKPCKTHGADHPLTDFRVANNLSRAALAVLLEVPRASITRWEDGSRKPDMEALARIKKKTGIEPRELRPDLVNMLGQ